MRRSTTIAAGMLCAAGLLTAACGGQGSGAQEKDYASKRIEVVVPFPAGGATDSLARIWSKCFEKQLGQTVTVVNREGGQGAVGSKYVKNAKPDGYTLEMVSDSPLLVVPYQAQNIGYKYDDFDYVAMLGYSPDILFTRPDSKLSSVEAATQALRSGDNSIKIAEYSPITSSYIRGAQMAKNNDFAWNTIPFDSGADWSQAVASGDADLGYGDINIPLVELANAGKLKILAAAEDLSAFKNGIPTLEDAGLQKYDGPNSNIVYLVGPLGMPKEVTSALERTVKTCRESDKLVKDAFQVKLLPSEGTEGAGLDSLVDDVAKGYQNAIAEAK